MSITDPNCPNKYCEFCDTAEDVYRVYASYEEIDREANKGRFPGMIDESN